MKPAPFDYRKVSTVAEAAALLRDGEGDAKIIAGGQSLGAMMNMRAASPKLLVDIDGIATLKTISQQQDHLCIGSMVRHVDVMEHPDVKRLFPVLAYAYTFVAHAAIRNRGTLGGNVSHADPASELPAVLQTLDARMRISDGRSERTVPATEFFKGMLETALDYADVLLAVEIPLHAAGKNWGFHEVSARHGDYAYLATALTCDLVDGVMKNVRIAYAGLAQHAMRCAEVESILEGCQLTPELSETAGSTASNMLPLAGDQQATEEYRRDLAQALTVRVLQMATT